MFCLRKRLYARPGKPVVIEAHELRKPDGTLITLTNRFKVSNLTRGEILEDLRSKGYNMRSD